MAFEQTLKKLRFTRGQHKASLTRFKTFVENFDLDNDDVTLLQVKFEKIEPVWNSFDTVQTEIELAVLDEDDNVRAAEDNERIKFEDDFALQISKAKSIIACKSGRSDNVSSYSAREVATTHDTVVNLPKINLPTFDGKWEEFCSFREEFKSLIENRADLPMVQKFRYLVRALEGEAALVIRAMEVTAENYPLAWQALEDRFHNKRRIVGKHIREILDAEKVDRVHPKKLQHLINSTSSHLRSLKSLGLPTDQWDALLVHIIARKLDFSTRQRWEQLGEKNELPTYTQLMSFLQKRVDECEILDEDKPASYRDNPRVGFPQREKIFHVRDNSKYQSLAVSQTANMTCEYCQNPHKLFFCTLFRQLNIQNRRAVVKTLDICENCLRKGHKVESCTGLKCRRCAEPHNTLLHDNAGQHPGEDLPIVSMTSKLMDTPVSRSLVLLSTAIIHVVNQRGKAIACRVLLDSGSQSNFLSEKIALELDLTPKSTKITVSGLGEFLQPL